MPFYRGDSVFDVKYDSFDYNPNNTEFEVFKHKKADRKLKLDQFEKVKAKAKENNEEEEPKLSEEDNEVINGTVKGGAFEEGEKLYQQLVGGKPLAAGKFKSDVNYKSSIDMSQLPTYGHLTDDPNFRNAILLEAKYRQTNTSEIPNINIRKQVKRVRKFYKVLTAIHNAKEFTGKNKAENQADVIGNRFHLPVVNAGVPYIANSARPGHSQDQILEYAAKQVAKLTGRSPTFTKKRAVASLVNEAKNENVKMGRVTGQTETQSTRRYPKTFNPDDPRLQNERAMNLLSMEDAKQAVKPVQQYPLTTPTIQPSYGERQMADDSIAATRTYTESRVGDVARDPTHAPGVMAFTDNGSAKNPLPATGMGTEQSMFKLNKAETRFENGYMETPRPKKTKERTDL